MSQKWTNFQREIFQSTTERIFVWFGVTQRIRNPFGLGILEWVKNSIQVKIYYIKEHYDDQFRLFTKDEYMEVFFAE